jgi:hypothetical protein
MEDNINFRCNIHNSIYDCPDTLIAYDEVYDEYSLIIHDGGCSGVEILFCPWCGKKLPNSMREKWLGKIFELNLDPIDKDKLPNVFQSSKWRL